LEDTEDITDTTADTVKKMPLPLSSEAHMDVDLHLELWFMKQKVAMAMDMDVDLHLELWFMKQKVAMAMDMDVVSQ
jgi:hypothetical protein